MLYAGLRGWFRTNEMSHVNHEELHLSELVERTNSSRSREGRGSASGLTAQLLSDAFLTSIRTSSGGHDAQTSKARTLWHRLQGKIGTRALTPEEERRRHLDEMIKRTNDMARFCETFMKCCCDTLRMPQLVPCCRRFLFCRTFFGGMHRTSFAERHTKNCSMYQIVTTTGICLSKNCLTLSGAWTCLSHTRTSVT